MTSKINVNSFLMDISEYTDNELEDIKDAIETELKERLNPNRERETMNEFISMFIEQR